MEAEDLSVDPFDQFRRWHADVVAAGLPEPSAMILATAPAGDGAQPLARHVLLRGVDHGFVWFTNFNSRKGRHLAANPRASLVFPWHALGRQVVVWGPVETVGDDVSDEYFATRPRESQLAAWASDQSEPVADRAALEERWAAFAGRFTGAVPRPPHWGGYRLVPDGLEVWEHRPFRLHDRFVYLRSEASGGGWSLNRLAP